MRETFQIVIDVVTDTSRKNLKAIKADVAQAEGAFGKLKTAGSGAMQMLEQNAVAVTATVAVMAATFAVKAVGAFEDTAKAALNLSTATGLSTEEASRWIGVADDYEVSADQLTTGIGKLTKTLDSEAWGKYGIATHDAAGKVRDAGDVLVDAMSTISALPTETERAKAGLELFGKGWANLSPLLGHTREEYEKMLGTVEGGQVITAGEAEKAERMRKAQDALGDALHDLTLDIGGAVAGLAPFVESLTKTISLLEKIPHLQEAAFNPPGSLGSIGDLVDDTMELGKAAIESGDAIQYLVDQGHTVKEAEVIMKRYGDRVAEVAEKAAAALPPVTHAIADVDDSSDHLIETMGKSADVTDNLTRASLDAGDALEAQKKAHEDAEQAAKDHRDALLDLANTELDLIDNTYAYQRKVIEAKGDLDEYNKSVAEGKLKGDDLIIATDDQRLSLIGVAKAYADSKGAVDGSKDSIDLQIESLYNQAAALDPKSALFQAVTGYIAELGKVQKNITTEFSIRGPGVITVNPYTGGAYAPVERHARGGIASGGMALVGEEGPELVDLPAGSRVYNNGQTKRMLGSGGGGDTFIVNNPIGEAYLAHAMRAATRAATTRQRYGSRLVKPA